MLRGCYSPGCGLVKHAWHRLNGMEYARFVLSHDRRGWHTTRGGRGWDDLFFPHPLGRYTISPSRHKHKLLVPFPGIGKESRNPLKVICVRLAKTFSQFWLFDKHRIEVNDYTIQSGESQ